MTPNRPDSNPSKLVAVLAGALFLGLTAGTLLDAPASAGPSPEPANKVAVSGSTLTEMTARIGAGETNVTKEVLSATLKTSGPTDLILQLTAECALFTKTVTVGNDVSEAAARVKFFLKIDGERVLTTSFDQGAIGADNGRIVFCDRLQGSETDRFENENATIRNYLDTRTANAFNWVVTDVGSGIHEIKVFATLEASVTDIESEGGAELPGDNGEAQAIIGQRTLVIEPTKLPTGTVV